MIAPKQSHHKVEQTDAQSRTPAMKPMKKRSWRFGDLPAAELMPRLQRHLIAQDADAQWQLVWLNNDGRPVIGLLPKVSWTVYFHSNKQSPELISQPNITAHTLTYKIIKTCRDIHHDNDNAVITAYTSYADWQQQLIRYSQAYDNEESSPTLTPAIDKTSRYHHGLIGFIGYDMASAELSPATDSQLPSQPCAMLGHYDIYLTPISDNADGWTLNIKTLETDNQPASTILTALISYLNILDSQLSNIDNSNQPISASASTFPLAPLILTAQWQKSDYQQAFAHTQRYLQQGDCYQINLTQAWQGRLNSVSNDEKNEEQIAPTLSDYLPALHRNTQAPFAGYLGVSSLETSHLENDGLEIHNYSNQSSLTFELLSCSPELFFTFIKDAKTGKHHIRTKPIKGTRPRGNNIEQDLVLKQQLINSDKDRAENVMIVDLLRNDLGKYAKTGSVKVPQLFAIESFSNVHHMVSTITAELTADAHPLAVLFGSLPAGSITGTPKNRAVEIISELEAAPRGAYCGTMGYMNFDGSGQWNVLIRTLQAEHSSSAVGQVSLWAGGGITIASDCDEEYQECLDKVGNLLQVLRQADTI